MMARRFPRDDLSINVVIQNERIEEFVSEQLTGELTDAQGQRVSILIYKLYLPVIRDVSDSQNRES